MLPKDDRLWNLAHGVRTVPKLAFWPQGPHTLPDALAPQM
jgi:hypothetical protein